MSRAGTVVLVKPELHTADFASEPQSEGDCRALSMSGQVPHPTDWRGAWRLGCAERDAELLFERFASMLGERASEKGPRLTVACPNKNKPAGSGTPCRNAPLDSGGR
jgi:hypothetical protein